MKRLTSTTALALLGALATGEAAAQTYRWTDERGQVNYSQGIDSIPERFRPSAQYMSSPPVAPVPAVTLGEPSPKSHTKSVPPKEVLVKTAVYGTQPLSGVSKPACTLTARRTVFFTLSGELQKLESCTIRVTL